ncbi:uncharacterized protein LOC133316124 [Gastrolobium bilobum]|uniref:uncharacterized protein LOC133316124 n=1 Tax=Gastrolobium bilobum TaxID=150636 RepID=UPI002AB1AB8C|nr:uncharacterized protein LOC133316124 [Gastrolobium bilobum]
MSTKKYKGRDDTFSHEQIMAPREEEWMEENISFKEMLMRHNGEWEMNDAEEEEAAREAEDVTQEDQPDSNENPQSEVFWEMDKDGKINFKLSNEFKKKAWRPWRKSVFVKLLGKKLALPVMKKRLENLWAREGQIYVTDVENGFFLVRFVDQKHMDYALTAGPWVLFDHYLTIRSWELDFQPFSASIGRIMACVRLPGFPVEYVNTELLREVGNWLGKFIKVDAATTSLARGKFARIFVELDLSNPLQAEYKIDGRLKKVEYEGLHLVCFCCGKYGHRSESYPNKMSQEIVLLEEKQDKQGN